MQHLDALPPNRPGWECFGAAGDGGLVSGLPIAWAPGSGATNFPAGTGLKLAKGEHLVIQVHYSLAAVADPKSLVDRTKIKLQLVDKVGREAFMVLHDQFVFSAFTGKPESLTPGLTSSLYNWTATLATLDFWVPATAGKQFDLFGVFPHMHKRGRKMKLTIQQPGKEAECMADVPRWGFDWQQLYLFDKPLPFDDKTVLRATCDYDTSDTQKPVLAGFGTDNEMCMFGMYLAVRK